MTVAAKALRRINAAESPITSPSSAMMSPKNRTLFVTTAFKSSGCDKSQNDAAADKNNPPAIQRYTLEMKLDSETWLGDPTIALGSILTLLTSCYAPLYTKIRRYSQ